MKWLMTIPVISLTLLASCGSDSGGNGSGSPTMTSTFIDSKVAGLEYRRSSTTGTTDSSAQFTCIEGEVVDFLVNGKSIGSAICKAIMTPYDIKSHDSLTDAQLFNIAYLLTNLDADNNPQNGISIDATKKGRINSNIDLSDDSAMDTLANTVRGATALISRTDATNHLKAFAQNAKKYSFNPTITHDPDSNCSVFPIEATFNGSDFSMKLNNAALTTNHVRGTPTTSVSTTTISFGGNVTRSANDQTAATINSGTPAYYKDNDATSSSTCQAKGETFVQKALRISNASLSSGVFAGNWSYTVVCLDGQTHKDYDECSGTFTTAN